MPWSYTVTATNPATGCTASASSTVTKSSNAAPTVTLSSTNPVICGSGSVTLTATSSVSPVYSYWYYSNVANNNYNGILNSNYISGSAGSMSESDIYGAGTYYVVVENETTLCIAYASANVIVDPALSITTNPVSPACFYGLPLPAITATASGGTSPYSYLWSTGVTSDAIYHVSLGHYTVTATDHNGCTVAALVSVVDCEKSLSTGITSPNSNNVIFNLYPNPANQNITVDYSTIEGSIYAVRVLDLLGNEVIKTQPVVSGSGEQKTEINLALLANGVYICELIGDERYRAKFVKQ